MHTRFGPFTLDAATRQLLDGGQPVHLSPKAFDVLRVLVEARPKVVNKADLHDRIWPGTFVVDANLSVLIGEIRRALGDSAQAPRFIRTVHKVGYAFCADAADGPAEARAPDGANTPRCWLAWNDRRFMLTAGDNIIGRNPECAIWIDASGVSRRHARVRLDADGGAAAIEDLEQHERHVRERHARASRCRRSTTATSSRSRRCRSRSAPGCRRRRARPNGSVAAEYASRNGGPAQSAE